MLWCICADKHRLSHDADLKGSSRSGRDVLVPGGAKRWHKSTPDMAATSRPRICIIGAGPCGLTALKNMLAAGLDDVVCYDEGQAIGGNWVFSDDPDRASVYASTHLISSRPRSSYEDHPFPGGFPVFPSHRQMRTYFESYAARFNLSSFIRSSVRVDRVAQRHDNRWSVRLTGADGGEQIFDQLVVCSGHHREPFVPAYSALGLWAPP
jgi:cation diffusion facilitator CzcD-associated flavoprotein CzcO